MKPNTFISPEDFRKNMQELIRKTQNEGTQIEEAKKVLVREGKKLIKEGREILMKVTDGKETDYTEGTQLERVIKNLQQENETLREEIRNLNNKLYVSEPEQGDVKVEDREFKIKRLEKENFTLREEGVKAREEVQELKTKIFLYLSFL